MSLNKRAAVWLSGLVVCHGPAFNPQDHKTTTKPKPDKATLKDTEATPRSPSLARDPEPTHSVPSRLALLSPTLTVTLEAVASWTLVWAEWRRRATVF